MANAAVQARSDSKKAAIISTRHSKGFAYNAPYSVYLSMYSQCSNARYISAL